MKVLYGALHDPSKPLGVNTANARALRGIGKKVDLHMLVAQQTDAGRRTGVSLGTALGLPALFAWKDARWINRFTFPGDNPVIDQFTHDLAEGFRTLGIDLVHVTDWEEPLGAAVFHAAMQVGIPWVISVIDHRFICPQGSLWHLGLGPCSGADEEFRKCSRCMATYRPAHGGALAPIVNLSRDVRYFLGLHFLLRYYGSPQQWKRRSEMLTDLLRKTPAIITHSRFHAGTIRDALGVPAERFKVIPFSIGDPDPTYTPSPDRFDPPMRFLWVNNVGRHWGLDMMIEAWRRARIPPEQAQLYLYPYPGYGRVYMKKCGELLPNRNVVIREERILGRESEVFGHGAAQVVSALWPVNAYCPDPWGRGVPLLAPDVDAAREAVEEGVHGLFYKMGDVDSLAALLRRTAMNPSILAAMGAKCTFVDEYSADTFGARHEAVYRELLGS